MLWGLGLSSARAAVGQVYLLARQVRLCCCAVGSGVKHSKVDGSWICSLGCLHLCRHQTHWYCPLQGHLMSGFLLAGFLQLATCESLWGSVCSLLEAAQHRLDSTPLTCRASFKSESGDRTRRRSHEGVSVRRTSDEEEPVPGRGGCHVFPCWSLATLCMEAACLDSLQCKASNTSLTVMGTLTAVGTPDGSGLHVVAKWQGGLC